MARPPGNVFSARHWHNRAEEVRAVAESMAGGLAREEMLQIAEAYDRMAQRADAIATVVTDRKTA